MRRDSTANTALDMFFAPVLGVDSINVEAKATAMAYGGTVSSFSTNLGVTAGMLPVTYDVNAWNTFIATGANPDGTTSLAANGLPQIQIYPSVSAPGNFGYISLNDSHVGANTLSNWINSGPSNSDISALSANGLIPVSASNNQWNWRGDTGFKASDVMAMNNQVGKTFIIPLFKPYNSSPTNYAAGTGQGANYFYNVVAFVGITIMPAPNSNRQVIVQPAPITTTTSIFASGSVAALSSSGNTSVTGLAPPRLTN
jgi:hypothetical protein